MPFSKKAQVELSLQQVIGLVLAIVIILATLALFMSLMDIFLGPPDSGSVATMNIVYDSVKGLYHKDNKNDSCIITASYIEGDWSLVGFNADKVVSADNPKITCELGEDCIEESCGIDDNIEKPNSCGKGPCICLCDGGGATGIGDVDGDDCKESNAICKKLAANIGFKRFYFVEDADECKSNPYGSKGSLCDLVMDGESCGSYDRGVKYSLVIKKHGSDALLLDLVSTKDRKTFYSDVKTDCRIMVKELKKFKPAPVKAEAKKEAGTVCEELRKAGNICPEDTIKAK
jgi:hypothetical protein